MIERKPVVQLCYEARKRLLFVLWDGIVFEDILYQMGRIRDTFIYGAADHGLSGEGNTGGHGSGVLSITQMAILSKYR